MTVMSTWRQKKQKFTIGIVALLATIVPVTVAHAAQTSSPHYQVNEAFFGSGGELNACSGTYCAKQSAGELGVGQTASAHYLAQGGFNTNREPSLTFVVDPLNTNLGTLTAGTPATATGTFSVKSYLTDGYVVVNASGPPQNGSHTMHALATPTASAANQEQFGINLVANTSPSVGTNPVQVPDSSFSFGTAATGYNTANFFKYAKGDVIAESLKSSGQTDYTISYLFNITNITPGGTYTMDHVLVATSTF